jgi:hypothetical protein
MRKLYDMLLLMVVVLVIAVFGFFLSGVVR